MNKYLNIEGKKIHYTLEGTGTENVLLVHGFPESIKNWKGFDQLFSEKYRTLAIDLPGFGESEPIAEVHTMTLFADVIKEVVEAEKISRFLLIGHSMGGYIGLEYARKYPGDLKGLVLLNSHALADSEEKKEGRLRQVEILKSGKKAALMKDIIPLMFAKNNEEAYKDIIDEFIRIAIETPTEAIIAALLGMRIRNNNLDFARNLSLPLLVLGGDKDRLIPVDVTLMHRNPDNPNVQVEILKNVGHASFIEAPATAFEIIETNMLK